jgi:hypothetical protein
VGDATITFFFHRSGDSNDSSDRKSDNHRAFEGVQTEGPYRRGGKAALFTNKLRLSSIGLSYTPRVQLWRGLL